MNGDSPAARASDQAVISASRLGTSAAKWRIEASASATAMRKKFTWKEAISKPPTCS